MENKEEVWKPIMGYKGFYEVSNLGNVRSIGRMVKNRWGGETYVKGKTMTQSVTAYGYKQVKLVKDGEVKSAKVHRLVAEAFISNPENLPCINHKDEVKTNNVVNNLEWCTSKYNTLYGTRVERCAKYQRENKGRPVDMYSLDGTFLQHYDYINETAKDGYNPASVLSCCKGKSISTKGVTFRFTGEKFRVYSELRGSLLIYRYINGKYDKAYSGYQSAANDNHIDVRRMKRHLDTSGFIAKNEVVLSLTKR